MITRIGGRKKTGFDNTSELIATEVAGKTRVVMKVLKICEGPQ